MLSGTNPHYPLQYASKYDSPNMHYRFITFPHTLSHIPNYVQSLFPSTLYPGHTIKDTQEGRVSRQEDTPRTHLV